jgi:hypothetical protein
MFNDEQFYPKISNARYIANVLLRLTSIWPICLGLSYPSKLCIWQMSRLPHTFWHSIVDIYTPCDDTIIVLTIVCNKLFHPMLFSSRLLLIVDFIFKHSTMLVPNLCSMSFYVLMLDHLIFFSFNLMLFECLTKFPKMLLATCYVLVGGSPSSKTSLVGIFYGSSYSCQKCR